MCLHCVTVKFFKLIFFSSNVGAAKLGTDESTFNAILATRSWAHLRQVMAEYQSLRGHSLEKAVASEFSAHAEKGLLGIRKISFHFLFLIYQL